MGDRTSIEWTDATWNPVRGCSRVSPGCENCYAERVAARFSGAIGDNMVTPAPYHGLAELRNGKPRWTGKVRLVPEHLADPLRWKRPRRVFVNSMSDLFHEGLRDEEIAAVFGVMAAAPQHTFQVLTKRAERMRAWCDWVEEEARGQGGAHEIDICVGHMNQALQGRGYIFADLVPGAWPLPNVWLGVSVEDQRRADERIPLLLQTPAAVRFLSVEPLLGPVKLADAFEFRPCSTCDGSMSVPVDGGGVACPACLTSIGGQGTEIAGGLIDWVIIGGESGPGARPCDVQWIRSLVQQCRAAGVATFVKQVGAMPHDSARSDFCDFHRKCIGPGCYPIHDRKGGDPSKWPEDLRVQDFPGRTA